MATTHVLTCRELVELVTEYLEGTMALEDRVRFDEHLGICDGCRNYLEQMRTTIGLIGRITEQQIAPEAQRKLLDVFRHWKQGA